ncbi:MAG: hypothetical protein OXG56_11325 [Gammaproteobacteria bacterium]|nr:hypothetical protein [Gammaproteobacteria bacterium]
MNQTKLDQAIEGIMRMRSIPHKRPKKPTRKDLERRFKLKIDDKGKPVMQEVELDENV